MARGVEPARIRRADALTDDERRTLRDASRSPFQTPAYATTMARAGAAVLVAIAERDGHAVGHAVVVEQRALGFKRWEGIAEPALADDELRADVWHAVLSAARRRGVVSAAWRDATLVRLGDADVEAAAQATKVTGGAIRASPCGTYRVDLTLDPERRWQVMNKRHRNVIRRARRDKVQVERMDPATFLDPFMALSEATWARSTGGGPSRRLIGALLDEGVSDGWARPVLARASDGTPAAAAIVTAFGGEGRYLYGASDPNVVGASALLQWEAMDQLAAEGLHTYDLGGVEAPGSPSDDERTRGIRRFKRRFGGAWSVWPRLHLTLRPRAYRVARSAVRVASRLGWRAR